MPEKIEHYTKTEYQKAAVEFIKKKIQILNWTVLLIIFVSMLLITRFMHAFLDYIPMRSVVAMLTVIAGLAFISIYISKIISKRAIEAMDDYSDKLNVLLNTTRDINDIDFSDMLLDNIIDISMSMTKADGGSIVLLEGEDLVFKIVRGSMADKLRGTTIPKSQGIVGWVVDNGSTVRVQDVGADDRFYSEVDKATSYETKSVICVPLKTRSGTRGALELLNKSNGAFTDADEEMLLYFADQASRSLEKLKFYEDEKNYVIHLTNILIEAIDNVSGKRGHSRKVAKYSLLMANALKMSDDKRKRLHAASMLHDIGFLKIRLDEVTSVEQFRAHSQLGHDMLKPITFYADIAPIILHHQEWYDGNGYPSGLKGNDIPYESRIIGIAEAFDAMVSRESYKQVGKVISKGIITYVVGFDNAIEELKKNSGTQFDPVLVEVFVKNIAEEDVIEAMP